MNTTERILKLQDLPETFFGTEVMRLISESHADAEVTPESHKEFVKACLGEVEKRGGPENIPDMSAIKHSLITKGTKEEVTA